MLGLGAERSTGSTITAVIGAIVLGCLIVAYRQFILKPRMEKMERDLGIDRRRPDEDEDEADGRPPGSPTT